MAAFEWFAAAAANVTITTNPADEWLAAINTMFGANSSDAAASWEVVNYASTSPKSVLLRRKAGGNGRIIIFGQQGSTPHASAVAGTGVASNLYIGYAPASSSNTPDASWLAGAPLSGTYLAGHSFVGTTTSYTGRLRYYDFADGVYLHTLNAAPNSTYAGAGLLSETVDGTAMETLHASGNTNLSTVWSSTNFIANTPTTNVAPAQGSPYLKVTHPTAGSLTCARIVAITAGAQQRLENTAASKINFHPVWFVGPTDVGDPTLVGKLRQICAGPYCLRETTKNTADSPVGVLAYGLGREAGTPGEAVWLTNVEV